ncbi:type III-B CRISPR module-associated Cmr3 family protein [Trebonia sp.]|uniref:type III-B CRISPR module-associated Cmr3 family protein n=1 Tax=Trebonia sp. TaxID=2767075 RepID=UPI00260B200F|nr:type III-B CRISPR module-associated Cmr3 family protein [Trebonia sp.]
MSALTLTLRQPAQLGDKPRDDFVLSTLRHVPGTAVRGAFAAAWIARNGAPEPGNPKREQFLRLFEGGVRFGALLLPGTEFDSRAVFRHKYDPDENRCRHVDYDQARGHEPPLQCPDCSSPLTQGKGLYSQADTMPAVRRRTSVAIDDEHEVASDGQLFTRETLCPRQRFTGTLLADDPADLDILRDLGPIRVGGRRTTHGLAEVAIDDGEPPEPQQLDPLTFVLRLRSPAIFTDACGRPRPKPSGEELEEALGVPAFVERRWSRWQEVGGWHVASGVPKATELAVCAGSAFLIHTERPVAAATLLALSRRGVGLRRHEGFGDLAPVPALRDGTEARDARARCLKRLEDRVAALKGVQVRFPDRWPRLRALLVGHARGDAEASRQLRGEADAPFDAHVGLALRLFLDLPPGDAKDLAEELGWLLRPARRGLRWSRSGNHVSVRCHSLFLSSSSSKREG